MPFYFKHVDERTLAGRWVVTVVEAENIRAWSLEAVTSVVHLYATVTGNTALRVESQSPKALR